MRNRSYGHIGDWSSSIETKVPFRTVSLVRMGRTGRPTYGAKEAERVRAVAKRLLATKYENNNAKLGRAIGEALRIPPLSGQAIGKFVGGSGGPSEQTVRGIAKLDGVTEWELLGRATASERVYEKRHRFSNAERAAIWAEGRVEQEAIDWVLSGQPKLAADASPDEWLQLMLVRDDELRRARLGLGLDRRAAAKQEEASQARVDVAKSKDKPKMPQRKR